MPRERRPKTDPSRDPGWIADMLKAGRTVIAFVRGKSRADYAADLLLRSGVERQVMIVGEAAYHLTDEFKAAHPQIAWRAIEAQRHRLVHDYGETNDDLIWTVATVHVPRLIEQLEALGPGAEAGGG